MMTEIHFFIRRIICESPVVPGFFLPLRSEKKTKRTGALLSGNRCSGNHNTERQKSFRCLWTEINCSCVDLSGLREILLNSRSSGALRLMRDLLRLSKLRDRPYNMCDKTIITY